MNKKRRRKLSLRTVPARATLRSVGTLTHYRVIQTPSEGGQPAGSYNVKDSGAHGNGSDDDRQHILDAITAAGSSPVYFPPGEYLLSSALTVPDGADLCGPYHLGPDACTAWLKGQVYYDSSQTFTDLKFGDSLKWTENVEGATSTSFTRCHFRGGGGSDANGNAVFKMQDGVSYLTLTDCEFERNLITDTVRDANQVNKQFANVSASVSISATTYPHHITFTGCTFGVSNEMTAGQDVAYNTGAPFVDLIFWTHPSQTGGTWHHVTVSDCEFRYSEWHCIDLACYPAQAAISHSSGNVLIENCLFDGAANTAVASEGPKYTEVSGCTIGPCGNPYDPGGFGLSVLSVGDDDTLYTYGNYHDNVFDWTNTYDARHEWSTDTWMLHVCGGGNTVTDNYCDTSDTQGLKIEDCHHSTVSGNVMHDHDETRTAARYGMFVNSSDNNDLTNNKIWARDEDYSTGYLLSYNSESGNTKTGTEALRYPTAEPSPP